MDPQAQVALYGMVGVIATALSIIGVAVVNSKKERHDSVDLGVEKTLRQDNALQADKIQDLLDDKRVMRDRIDELVITVENQGLLIARQTDMIEQQAKAIGAQEIKP